MLLLLVLFSISGSQDGFRFATHWLVEAYEIGLFVEKWQNSERWDVRFQSFSCQKFEFQIERGKNDY